MKRKINLLITDLDDTIWDWITMLYASFKPYLYDISQVTNISVENLKKDFRDLHQKYGTSECSDAYYELKSINSYHIRMIETEENGINIIHQFYKNKRANLHLYNGVLETLKEIKRKGTKIIGFTESNVFYTQYRIKILGLDGIFDYIYASEDHKVPQTMLQYYPIKYWNSANTHYNILPQGTKKPDSDILLKIIKEMNGVIENTIYIGDKLDRDIYMANKANVTSIYARYGHKIDNDVYALLKEVTHWTNEDVEREKIFKNNIENMEISPTYSIDSFNEILDKFVFMNNNEKSLRGCRI